MPGWPRGARARRDCYRNQIELRASDLESLLAEDHRARLVWGYVERQELGRPNEAIKARGSNAGRAAIDPRILLALWLHAMVEGVGSGREIARFAREHDAYRWICGGVSVNYHALGDRQGAKGASPSQQRRSEPCCPRVMRVASRDATRSVDRGTCRPAIEPRKRFDPGADIVRSMEGNTHGCAIASASATRRGRRPWHAFTLLVREPGDLQSDRRLQSWPAARIGKVRSRRR